MAQGSAFGVEFAAAQQFVNTPFPLLIACVCIFEKSESLNRRWTPRKTLAWLSCIKGLVPVPQQSQHGARRASFDRKVRPRCRAASGPLIGQNGFSGELIRLDEINHRVYQLQLDFRVVYEKLNHRAPEFGALNFPAQRPESDLTVQLLAPAQA